MRTYLTIYGVACLLIGSAVAYDRYKAATPEGQAASFKKPQTYDRPRYWFRYIDKDGNYVVTDDSYRWHYLTNAQFQANWKITYGYVIEK